MIERFPAKWMPVRVKKTRQNKEIEPPFRFNRNGKGSRVTASRRSRMEWVLFVSLQWVVFGSPTAPHSEQIGRFASEELCKKAAEAVKAEINTQIGGTQRVQTLGRVVCLELKDK
jgi:hypothetical protein